MATVLERLAPKTQRKPEAGTVHWFNECVESGKIGPFAVVARIVPGLASHILSVNIDNRAMKPIKQGQYATDIAEGRWALNGETIIVADDGLLNDGQNRLVSVVEAGCPIDTFVVFGVGRETRTTVDQGAARTAGDYLGMLGISHGHQIAGIARLVMAFEQSAGKSIAKAKDFTNAEVVRRGLNDTALRETATYASGASRFTRGMVTPSIIGACLYILTGEHKADAAEYINQIVYGENIRRGDPAYAVRNALANLDRAATAARAEMIFRGWNAFRQNRQLTLAKSLGAFPVLV